MKPVNSTRDFYKSLVAITEHLSFGLFGKDLPIPLLTLSRRSRSRAHYNSSCWREGSGGEFAEICLNPALFAQHSWLNLMQSLTEQLCHHWQHTKGTPSRPGYHNREWARKLESVGLMPSSTGLPGGKKTGQIMASYPLPDSNFVRLCEQLASDGLHLPLTGAWTDLPDLTGSLAIELDPRTANQLTAPVGIWSSSDDASSAIADRRGKRKLKYSCPKCGTSVWGRSGLALECRACKLSLREVETPAGQGQKDFSGHSGGNHSLHQ